MRSGRTSSTPKLQRLPRLHQVDVGRCAVIVAAEQLALALADQHGQPRPALAQRADLADVVEVVVGEQHVRGLDPEALGSLDQWRDRPAGVDEEGRAALAVGHQIGVGEELRMHGALDEHRAMFA